MPLFRRFGRPGLLGAIARTSVVAGTATMTARAVSRGMDDRARAAAGVEARKAAVARTQASPPPTRESVTSQLSTLSSLKSSGAISADEFNRAKQRVLGG